MPSQSKHLKPLILLACQESWHSRELASALTNGGYRVTMTHDEPDTMDAVQTQNPHGIIIDAGLAPPGLGLCRMLRVIAVTTPIILTHTAELSRAQRIDARRAGAWDVHGAPLDLEELLLELAVFTETKLELDHISAECLIDRVSGLYNPAGLARRAQELAALATRHGLALGCVVFQPEQPLPNRAAGDRLALAFKAVARHSDAIGRTAQTEFAIYAPATSSFTAPRLVRRMVDSVEREFGYLPERGQRVGVCAGYTAVGASHKISPSILLSRARRSLEINRSAH
jgi:DNA-binding response OmpR family regulator